MARDSSGTMSAPLPDVVSGDVIEANWANTTINDIGAELTDSLSRSGKGNMSAALKVIAGSVSAPGLSFVSEANSGLYRASAGDIRMALNSAEAWRVTSAGFRVPADITLANGNVKIGTAAKGIDFSEQTPTAATGAATTAEILNHYEEGTWTPNLWDFSLSSGEGQTYGTQQGKFTRIGNLVYYICSLAVTSLGTLTGSNSMYIGPLPYTPSATPIWKGGSVSYAEIIGTVPVARLEALIQADQNYIRVQKWDTDFNGSTPFTITEFGLGSIGISGFYPV